MKLRLKIKQNLRKRKKPAAENPFLSGDGKKETPDRIRAQIEACFNRLAACKEKIILLTEAATQELLTICQLEQKLEVLGNGRKKNGETHQTKNPKTATPSEPQKKEKARDSKKPLLDYELANMKMVRKLLHMSENAGDRKFASQVETLRKRVSLRFKKKHRLSLERENNGRPKILIVEDDPTTVNIISYILSNHNYRVSSSLNAEDGLKTTLKESPDLIILDIMLPGMDGFQLLSLLKENEETAHIPVVIISSLSGEKYILKGLEIGATDYILKPFSPKILFLKVQKILSAKNEHTTSHRRV